MNVVRRPELYRLVDVHDGAIDRAVEAVDERYPGKRAWFVGSRVDGDPRPGSDLDMVVEATPSLMKSGGGFGAGTHIDVPGGVDVDISEDEDGPIWRGEGSQVRFR